MTAYRRPPNGSGTSGTVTLELNLHDPVQRRAYEMACKLAVPHGRRKALLVQFLNALADFEEKTNRLPTADLISSSVISAAFMGRPVMAVGAQVDAPPPLPAGKILVGSGGKPDEEKSAAAFSSGFASRFKKN